MTEMFFTDAYLSSIVEACKFIPKSINLEPNKNRKVRTYLERSNYPNFCAYMGFTGPECIAVNILNNPIFAMVEEKNDYIIFKVYKDLLFAIRMKEPYSSHYNNRIRAEEARMLSEIKLVRKFNKGQLEQIRQNENAIVKNFRIVRERFQKMNRGICKILEKDSRLPSMHERERTLMGRLKKAGVVKILEGRVVKINWDRYDDLYPEDIKKIVVGLPGNIFTNNENTL